MATEPLASDAGARATGDRAALRGVPPTERDAKGRVRHEALTDPLTQLPNRLHFDVVYRLLWEAAGRGIAVTLVRIEIAGLGGASDDVQRRVGERLGLTTRQMDMIARLDGDGFGLLLMDCNAFGGMIAAERFQAELTPLLSELQLPFNAGIAAWKESMTRPDDLLAGAEQALATARSFGPGRVEVQHA